MAGFTYVNYVDPFAPLPIGADQAGVMAGLSGAPANTVPYAMLLGNQLTLGYGASSSAANVRVLNQVPLVVGQYYQLLVQFQAQGKDPDELDWSDPDAVISSPVVVEQGRIDSVQVSATGLAVSWQPSASAPGGFVELIDLTRSTTTSSYAISTTPNVTLAATFATDRGYGVRVSAALPVTGGDDGNFAAPFTSGPPSAVLPIPTAAPTLTGLRCTDTGVAASWTAPVVPSGAGPVHYEILLLDSGKLIAAGPAGATGGQLVTSELAGLAAPQLAARVSYGSLVGPTGGSAALYPASPRIGPVTVTGSDPVSITAQLTSAGALPAGGSLLATLYVDGVAGPSQTLATATGTVTWSDITVDPAADYAIDVALQVSTGGATSLGTPSARLPVPLSAPSGVTASYDGEQLSIDLTFAGGASGYQVTLTGGGVAQQQLQAGPELPITFTSNLDLDQAWTVTVVPVIGRITARAGVGAVSLPAVVASVLTGVGYDGAELTVRWTAATLPYLTGYRVVVAGGPTLVVGPETSCRLPLTPDLATGAGVTVTGVSSLRDTPVSAPVAVLTGAIVVDSVVVGDQVVASWTADPTLPAVRAVLMLGGSVIETLPDATTTGVSFSPPSPADQPYTLVAYPVSADELATGPASAPVPLILAAPSITSGQLADGSLELHWTPAGQATGYRLTATPAAGDPAELTVTGTSYLGPAPAAFSQPGTLTVTPIGDRCVGPAASVTIAAPATVSEARYADGVLTVTADLTAAAADTSWLDVLANGTLVARQQVTGQGSFPVTLPVPLPAGVAASVRVSTVGPATLAPPGVPVSVPTRAPVLLDAAWDGSQLHVTWTPTGEPGVTGYWITVSGGSQSTSYVSGAASGSTALDVELGYPFDVLVDVRAAAGSPTDAEQGIGQPSAGRSPTLAGHCYGSAVSETGYPPYLYRRGVYQTLASVAGQPITAYLAKPFEVAGNPTVPDSEEAPVFQLAPAPAGSALPYQLTLSAEVWTSLGANPVRTELRDSYNAFLTEVEAVGVTPWGIGLIRQLIAEAMPQLYEEVLFYRYGYWRSDSLRVLDLMPGTQLQVSTALHQSVVSGTDERNGFLAAGSQLLDVVQAIPQGGAGTQPLTSPRILSVDALLSLLYPGSGTAQSVSPVAAGPLDFFTADNRQCYYRLFFPPDFPPSGSSGSTSLTSNIALIGSTNWATLTSVTSQYAATGTFPSGLSYFASYFRGLAALTPLINLSVQGESRWLAVGTSVRQALTTIGLAPYEGGSGGELLSLRRASANLFDYPTPGDGLSLDPVDLTNAELAGLTPLYWPLDMPLVGGDQLAVRQLPA